MRLSMSSVGFSVPKFNNENAVPYQIGNKRQKLQSVLEPVRDEEGNCKFITDAYGEKTLEKGVRWAMPGEKVSILEPVRWLGAGKHHIAHKFVNKPLVVKIYEKLNGNKSVDNIIKIDEDGYSYLTEKFKNYEVVRVARVFNNPAKDRMLVMEYVEETEKYEWGKETLYKDLNDKQKAIVDKITDIFVYVTKHGIELRDFTPQNVKYVDGKFVIIDWFKKEGMNLYLKKWAQGSEDIYLHFKNAVCALNKEKVI